MNSVVDSLVFNLDTNLKKSSKNIYDLERIFIQHLKSNFIELYINEVILKLRSDTSVASIGIVNRIGANFINNELIDYSIRLLESPLTNESVKWLGVKQIFAVKGKGNVRFRILEVPKENKINAFKKGIEYTVLEETILYDGDIISCLDRHKIINILEVSESIILESFTLKDKNTELYWNFDNQKRSNYAECSNPIMSRIESIINLSNKMNYIIPNDMIDYLYCNGNNDIKLKIIKKLLLEKNHCAFDYLESAISSSDPVLSKNSQLILNLF